MGKKVKATLTTSDGRKEKFEYEQAGTKEIRISSPGVILGNPGGGVKHDQNKVRLDLVPYDVVMEIAKILTFGAKKYADRNWERGFDWGRVYAALQRHLFLWFSGQDNDPETGKSHLSHAGCCLFFLLAFVLRGTGKDDRPKLSEEQIKRMTECEFPIWDPSK